MGKLASFLALDRTDRIATIEAIGDLVAANLLVRFVAPRRWRDRFGSVSGPPGDCERMPRDLATVRRVRLAVARARRNVPTGRDCLAQALAARRMLARRGIAGDLFIGASTDAGAGPRFHAWFKVGNEWVTGQCDESRYSLFTEPEAPASTQRA